MSAIAIRLLCTALVALLAGWWVRRTLPFAPRAAVRAFRWGTIALGGGLAGYLLLFVWYGVLRQSLGGLAVALACAIGSSGVGIILLGAARQARRASGERARPLF